MTRQKYQIMKIRRLKIDKDKIEKDLELLAVKSGRQTELNWLTDHFLSLKITGDILRAREENRQVYEEQEEPIIL